MAQAWGSPAVALLSSPVQEETYGEEWEPQAQGGAFLAWGLWECLADKEPGNVVLKCEDTRTSGAPPAAAASFLPSNEPGTGHILSLPGTASLPLHCPAQGTFIQRQALAQDLLGSGSRMSLASSLPLRHPPRGLGKRAIP